MMSIIDRLTKRQQAKQLTAAEQYRNLLERLVKANAEPTDKDVEQLENLVAQLRFDASQVDTDMAYLKTLHNLESIAAKQFERTSALQKANEQWKEHDAYVKSEVDRLRAEQLEMSNMRGKAYSEHQTSLTAETEINQIYSKSPHLRRT